MIFSKMDPVLTRGAIVSATLMACAALANQASAAEAKQGRAILGDAVVHVDVGPSLLKMHDISFLNVSSNPGANITSEVISYDGNQDGVGTSFGVDGVSFGDHSFGVNGFFARLSDTQSAACTASASQLCTISNLYDAADGNDQTLDATAGNTASSNTKRTVHDYGVGVEWQSAGLKNTIRPEQPGLHVGYRGGVSYRRIAQDTDISGGVVRASYSYEEDLDTDYYGGYVGLDMTYKTESQWTFGLNTKLGADLARVNYDGKQVAASGVVASYNYTQNLSLDETHGAYSGKLGVHIGRAFERFNLSFYSNAEWLSYNPYMAYNNSDVDDGTGTNMGTSIRSSRAWGVNYGLRLNIAL